MRGLANGGEVKAARIRAVYDQMPVTLATPLIIACLTAAVLFRATPLFGLLLWLGSIVGVTALRFGLWFAHKRGSVWKLSDDFWIGATLAGSAASGILWGVGAAVVFPPEQSYQLFLAFVIGGLCAGSFTVNSSHMQSVLAFLWPATIPLACRFLLQGSLPGIGSGSMTIVYACALSLTARKFHLFFGEAFRLQLALSEKTHQLSEANARLEAEIAERQATEASLRQAQKMEAIGRLTAGMAHDFNNLLTVIIGSVEMLQTKPGPEARSARRLSAISEAADRGARLTRQLVAFARKQVLRPQAVDLNSLVRGMRGLLDSAVSGRARLRLQLADDLWVADLDRVQIEQAILNLAVNARDAIAREGTITIETANVTVSKAGCPAATLAAGDYVSVTVCDTGCGMSAEVLAHAFDPFFTTKETGAGSGLGLSQVYGIVQQSGGVTGIQSEPGQGTHVTLYFPRSPEAVARGTEASEPVGFYQRTEIARL